MPTGAAPKTASSSALVGLLLAAQPGARRSSRRRPRRRRVGAPVVAGDRVPAHAPVAHLAGQRGRRRPRCRRRCAARPSASTARIISSASHAQLAEQLGRRAAEVVVGRDAVDLRQRRVDPHVAQLGSQNAEADGRVGEQRVEQRDGVGRPVGHREADSSPRRRRGGGTHTCPPTTSATPIVCRGWRRRSVGLPGLKIWKPSRSSCSGMCEWPKTTASASGKRRPQPVEPARRRAGVVDHRDAAPAASTIELVRARRVGERRLVDVAEHRAHRRADAPRARRARRPSRCRRRAGSGRRRAAPRRSGPAAPGARAAGACRR